MSVVGCGLWVAGCGLRVAGCGLRVAGCGLFSIVFSEFWPCVFTFSAIGFSFSYRSEPSF